MKAKMGRLSTDSEKDALARKIKSRTLGFNNGALARERRMAKGFKV